MRGISNARLALGLAAGLVLATAPVAAPAQTPSYATNAETIRGTISALTGKYTLTLADERGFADNVRLHDGTVINPTGFTLQAGVAVVITGHADGPAFDADEIDRDDGASYDEGSAPAYAGPYAANAYPVYGPTFGYGFGYGYGYNGYGYAYPGFGYPPYPGYYPCCFVPQQQGSPPHGSRPIVPVVGRSIPLPHPIRIGAPVAPISVRAPFGGVRSGGGGVRSSGGGVRSSAGGSHR